MLLEEDLANKIIDDTDPKELKNLEMFPLVSEALARQGEAREDYIWYDTFLKKLDLEVEKLSPALTKILS